MAAPHRYGAMRTLERQYVEGIIRAAAETFESLTSMVPLSVEELSKHSDLATAEVAGRLLFTGESPGLVALDTSRALVRVIRTRMLADSTEPESDDGLLDAFGELLNVITGTFKDTWIAAGGEMSISIPQVYLGDEVPPLVSSDDTIGYSCRLEFANGAVDVHLRLDGAE